MHVFPLAQGYKSEPTENFTLCCRFIGAPANSSGRKWEEKQSHSAGGSQLSGSCGLPMAKIHRHQKPASCPWKGELMLECNPGKCSHIASRDREVWEISSCLCMVCDLDRIVSLDGPSCFSTAGKLQWQNTWSALQCGFFQDLLSPVQSQKATGVSQHLHCSPFQFSWGLQAPGGSPVSAVLLPVSPAVCTQVLLMLTKSDTAEEEGMTETSPFPGTELFRVIAVPLPALLTMPSPCPSCQPQLSAQGCLQRAAAQRCCLSAGQWDIPQIPVLVS